MQSGLEFVLCCINENLKILAGEETFFFFLFKLCSYIHEKQTSQIEISSFSKNWRDKMTLEKLVIFKYKNVSVKRNTN